MAEWYDEVAIRKDACDLLGRLASLAPERETFPIVHYDLSELGRTSSWVAIDDGEMVRVVRLSSLDRPVRLSTCYAHWERSAEWADDTTAQLVATELGLPRVWSADGLTSYAC
ncbi:hypothetical protein Pan216_20700 [Planctomycetes bacterium Pan216]|uniref:Uncharacterized protein n=1 Tax=Kolteria novifilia TaxID=2527975 RepID=A0A518B2Q4_9BACT|nr:hypothetical protein Pan216_20700 [Planctomycetes bacterium Pan216]